MSGNTTSVLLCFEAGYIAIVVYLTSLFDSLERQSFVIRWAAGRDQLKLVDSPEVTLPTMLP